MILSLFLSAEGLHIGVGSSEEAIHVLPAPTLLSEAFLGAIKSEVKQAGGWPTIHRLLVNPQSASFSGSRALGVLVNALAALHALPVRVWKTDISDAVDATLPLEPDYAGEPNIGISYGVLAKKNRD